MLLLSIPTLNFSAHFRNNFDRLLNKNLGSVDLVALTKLEHIILSEKDSDGAEDTDDRSTTSSQSNSNANVTALVN